MRVRHLHIENFRGIQRLTWCPQAGINCLIGPGDCGKSTILDAIYLCLGAGRIVAFTDADFHALDLGQVIKIEATVGDLDDAHLNLDKYGLYLRGFSTTSCEIEDEPSAALETVLTVRLAVDEGLEPNWELVSSRAEEEEQSRGLSWKDRLLLAPTRIGTRAAFHLGWRPGSVLTQVAGEPGDASAARTQVARDTRRSLDRGVGLDVEDTLSAVSDTARTIGVPSGANAQMMLDPQAVEFGANAITLHDENGVPLRSLGTGSLRLLVAGLQAKAASSRIALVDEAEFGLEPHRIIRFIDTLGAKQEEPGNQVFMTSHSPIVVRELNGDQLNVVRREDGGHRVLSPGTEDAVQGALRSYPEAFLADSVLVCEGPTEVGLIRGLDRHQSEHGEVAISACGAALVNAGGASKVYHRANVFLRLGYRTAVLRDDDVQPNPADERDFRSQGGTSFEWRSGNNSEDELLSTLPDEAVVALVASVSEQEGADRVRDQLRSRNDNQLLDVETTFEASDDDAKQEATRVIAQAAHGSDWFKTVGKMQAAAVAIVAPNLADADPLFAANVKEIFDWLRNGWR